jgi:predicted ABC-type exoprotein transport system permease subunit
MEDWMSGRELVKPLVRWAIAVGVLAVLRIVLPLVLAETAANVAIFVTVALIVILTLIYVGVNFTSRLLRERVPMGLYRAIEYTIIACIIGGVLCVFQPWSVAVYRVGWLVLLVVFFPFITWSHVVPAKEQATEGS